MPFYRICPLCHAYLDFGERCDCQDKETAPDAANIEDGQEEIKYEDQGNYSGV